MKSIGERRKQEIIKAFYSEANKKGLENTSIAIVAERAGVNPSLIIHYFKSREGLLLSLVDYILERYLTIYHVKSTVDTKEKLVETIGNLFSRKWNRLFSDGVFYSCYAQIYQNKQFKLRFKELHDLLHEKLQKTLDEAVAHGVISVDNTSEMSEIIFALVDGAYYYLGMVDDKEAYSHRVAVYRQTALRLLKLDEFIAIPVKE